MDGAGTEDAGDASRPKSGGQPGNQNARKHGFYSKSLTPEQQETIVEARKADILTEEIAFMRVKVQALVDDPTTTPTNSSAEYGSLLASSALMTTCGSGPDWEDSFPPCARSVS